MVQITGGGGVWLPKLELWPSQMMWKQHIREVEFLHFILFLILNIKNNLVLWSHTAPELDRLITLLLHDPPPAVRYTVSWTSRPEFRFKAAPISCKSSRHKVGTKTLGVTISFKLLRRIGQSRDLKAEFWDFEQNFYLSKYVFIFHFTCWIGCWIRLSTDVLFCYAIVKRLADIFFIYIYYEINECSLFLTTVRHRPINAVNVWF